MGSMCKIKTGEDVTTWMDLIGEMYFVVTPKYNGLSILYDTEADRFFTRGDGTVGEDVTDKVKMFRNVTPSMAQQYASLGMRYVWGKAIMRVSVFNSKYSDRFANPRNLVAGTLNSKTIDDDLVATLGDICFMTYGAQEMQPSLKSTQLDALNTIHSSTMVPHIGLRRDVCQMSQQMEAVLIATYNRWAKPDSPDYIDFEIDGVIVEVDAISRQEALGHETWSLNPRYARAFKHTSFTDTTETTVRRVEWSVSKQGLLKPVLVVDAVRLNGATITRVTGNNAKFLKDNNIGEESVIRIVRSGMVIPKVVGVKDYGRGFAYPTLEGGIHWNDSGAELVADDETHQQKVKQMVAFFEIMDADEIGPGVCEALYDAGYDDMTKVLSIQSPEELEGLDGFGKKKAKTIYNNIVRCVRRPVWSKLVHALGIFKAIGSKRLASVEHFYFDGITPSTDDIKDIEGFSDVLAAELVSKWGDMVAALDDKPVLVGDVIPSTAVSSADDAFKGHVVVFTGFRDKALEALIEQHGGKIGAGVTGKTTDLVMRETGSGSSKEKKALLLGVKIWTAADFESMMKNL